MRSEEYLINPRKEIADLIAEGNTEELLLKSGLIHGHFCPGLSQGVMAAAYGMKSFMDSDGMEDIVAIPEINSCFVDGIQFVSGCTIGNNALIYRDMGKTAVTFTKRGSNKGIRIVAKRDYFEKINKTAEGFGDLLNEVVNKNNRDPKMLKSFKETARFASFEMLKWDFDELYYVQEVVPELPTHAKIVESFTCDSCGESGMTTRRTAGTDICYRCSKISVQQLDGTGISEFVPAV